MEPTVTIYNLIDNHPVLAGITLIIICSTIVDVFDCITRKWKK